MGRKIIKVTNSGTTFASMFIVHPQQNPVGFNILIVDRGDGLRAERRKNRKGKKEEKEK
jgi:hypothetical protein